MEIDLHTANNETKNIKNDNNVVLLLLQDEQKYIYSVVMYFNMVQKYFK